MKRTLWVDGTKIKIHTRRVKHGYRTTITNDKAVQQNRVKGAEKKEYFCNNIFLSEDKVLGQHYDKWVKNQS